ncbi:35729_t:CDS:2, partial [Racocetra persica]
RKSKIPVPSSPYTSERQESPGSSSSAYISDQNTPNETRVGGRGLSPVWKYFQRQKTKSNGYYSAKCDYCSTKWSRGEPVKLEAHLAFECSYAEEHVRQFYLLHPNAYLQQAIHELNIPGGGLRKFVDTRWTSAYECTLSVSQLEYALIKATIFFSDLKILIKVLSPIRTAIMNLEAQSTTLADCFIQFVSLAAAIKRLSSVGLREKQFHKIAQIAIQIWKCKGYDLNECANLIAYMRLFKEKKDGFDLPYSFEKDTPLL